MQNSALKRACLVAALLGLFATSHAQGQSGRALELISFNGTTWRYLKDGSDQGTAWTARTFNDSGSPWASGQGLLGYETTPAVYPYPFNTTFAGYDPLVLTYYFRAHFTLAASDFVPFMTMVATNFADDGAVVFLNGTEVARIRVPAGQNSTTLSPGPAAEGQYEVNSIATNALLVGDNVIAVEVHQANNASSDIVHGMSLFANYPAVSSVAFTSQPQGGTYNVGSAVTLSATTSGGPVFYQWQTNNGSGVYVDIPGATSSNYFTGTLTVAGTNSYRLIASNSVNSVVSSVAVIAVVSDTFGICSCPRRSSNRIHR